MMKFAIFLALLGMAVAVCPNDCSKHGSCGEHDKCTCDPNWMSGDCSQAKCPYGASWGKQVTGSAYAECSANGVCDRKTGLCECAPGYTGTSCQRTVCVDSCSGHGVCGAPITTDSNVQKTLQQTCVCDYGWSGYKCNQRLCPHGDDPLTTTDADKVLLKSIAQRDEVQRVVITSATTAQFAVDTFTVTYTDKLGEKYTTFPLPQSGLTSGQVRRALVNLPNSVVPNVTVALSATTTANTIDVTFVDAANSGDQEMLVVNTDGCKTAGCVPMYYGFVKAAAGSVAYTETTKGTKEWVECAGRGTCDRETGVCACYKGFHGDTCSLQSTLA